MLEGLTIFALVFTASAATPGPDTMTIFGRALSGGRSSAVPFVLGVVLGKLTLLTLVMLGLAALAQALGPLFIVIKLAGAAYLVWAGIRLWRSSVGAEARALEKKVTWRDALTGYALSISNPHAIVFYVALLPTVIEVQNVTFLSYLLLCLILSVLMTTIAGVYTLAADRLRHLLRSERARRVSNRIAGGVMIGSGVVVATR